MGTAALLLAAGAGARFDGPLHKLAAPWGRHTVIGAALRNVLAAELDHVIVVTGSPGSTDALNDALASLVAERIPATVAVVDNADWVSGQASSLQVGVSAARRLGCDAIVVGLGDQPAVVPGDWRAVAEADASIVVARYPSGLRPPVMLRSDVWDLLPAAGDVGARDLIATRPDLVHEVAAFGNPRDVDTIADLLSDDDRRYVRECLGRPPRCAYSIAARASDGRPMVIANEPFLDDGTPMPTLYWLIDPELSRRLGTLEAAGGVNRSEAEIPASELAAAHRRYSDERDALIDPGRLGPRPSGGVGGTRVGVKCLHTHYAWWLAGGDDPVAEWAAGQLGEESR